MYNILVCDDDKDIVEAIDIYLSKEGYNIIKAYDGMEAMEILKKEDIQLLLIDVMMPRLDGIRATLKIREKSIIPIIILSAKSEDSDKIIGLDVGADDYITKPFNPLELIARVKSAYRRYTKYNEKNEENIIYINGLEIDQDKHICKLYDKQVELTPMEFDILLYLAQKRGNVVSSEELFEKVWKEKYLENNNTVMVHIRRIREKLKENTKNPKFIKTVWGVGYKIEKWGIYKIKK